ncbi:MAG: GNAT family N-acetyltransferase [Planctomycetia bacterium]|nr:GNAT family N-acetyltransferase [Planctomycetia bacterium]
MSHDLDLHPASADERLAAYRNVFDVWPYAGTVEAHVQRRLDSVQHHRAGWFVGTLSGRVVTSLACYDLPFQVRGRVVPGIAIGSVHTLSEFRGQGFARRLIEHVEEHERRRGTALSVLYSDIGTNYYARLGYSACPSHEGWIDLSASGGRQSPAACDDAPTSPHNLGLSARNASDAVEELAHLYSADHGAAPLCIHRGSEYWDYLLRKSTAGELLSMAAPGGEFVGYARIRRVDTPGGPLWRIHDLALPDRRRWLGATYDALVRLARSRGAARLGGWMPNDEVSRRRFQIAPRAREITMLKPLREEIALDADMIAAADGFCEIDHV